MRILLQKLSGHKFYKPHYFCDIIILLVINQQKFKRM